MARVLTGFTGGSDNQESACNASDLGADSTHSSKCGLSPREQLERQVKLHSFTHDEALLSCPNSSGTLWSEFEMERNP